MTDDPTYTYQDQDGVHTITRSQILDTYFPWWAIQMTCTGRADQITDDACVEDFLVVHWAWKAPAPRP